MCKLAFRRLIMAAACAAILLCSFPLTSYADVNLSSGTQSYRFSVLNAIGAADSSFDSYEPCTRAEFAKLLVMSSSYRDTSQASSGSAAANDVPASYPGSQYIKTCLVNGWMRTRLGGNFAPESAVTLSDAARACIAALGYTDSDFGSNVTEERLSLFKSLGLADGVSASSSTDTLTKLDGVNVIYNLLRTSMKNSSSIYGSAIDLTLSANNELNVTNVIESYLVGPILCKTTTEFYNAVPFDIDSATYYFNGKNAGGYSRMYMESQITHNGWLVVYYNEQNKTIWAYGSDTGSSNYYCTKGKVTSIIYEDDNIAAPTSVCIDSVDYELSSSDVKFMFSMSGEIGIGDYVVLICKKTTDSQDNETYSAVAVIKWDTGTDGSTVGTIYAENAGHYTVKSGG